MWFACSSQGSCKSCPSSAVTLELAVEDAVRAAAPEISSIEVVAAERGPELRGDTGGVTADPVAQQQGARTRGAQNRHRSTAWQPVPELADLADGEVGGFRVAGLTALACRVGGDVGGRDGGGIYAYR